jgi:uncharacterized protein YdhG (YjbR/CyaY superfamily)
MTSPASGTQASATAQIDATLAALPADQRAALQSLRETIAAVAPEAEETISYGMPAFRYHGRPMVAFAAFKGHCSLFPMSSAVVAANSAALAAFDTATKAVSKGTIRFQPDHPLPNDLIATIVLARMARIDAARRR